MKVSDVPIINFDDAEQMARIMRHIASLKGVYRIEITRVRNQRSARQNAFYWGVVLPYAAKGVRDCFGEQERGFSSYDAHEFFKNRFLSRGVGIDENGECLGWIQTSTTELDTAQFAEYLNLIMQFCIDFLGVHVPAANRFYKELEGEHEQKLLPGASDNDEAQEGEATPAARKSAKR